MSEPPISRGFRGRKPGGPSSRIPPGQHLVTDFPVLSAGPTPGADLKSWRLTLEDGDSPVGEWTWDQFNALPQTELTVDIHCVTTWSKLDTNWRGVTIDTLLEAAGRGLGRRIDRDMLESVGYPPNASPRIFVCGPTPLVEAAARSLRDIGHEPHLIKTERFGPTGT